MFNWLSTFLRGPEKILSGGKKNPANPGFPLEKIPVFWEFPIIREFSCPWTSRVSPRCRREDKDPKRRNTGMSRARNSHPKTSQKIPGRRIRFAVGYRDKPRLPPPAVQTLPKIQEYSRFFDSNPRPTSKGKPGSLQDSSKSMDSSKPLRFFGEKPPKFSFKTLERFALGIFFFPGETLGALPRAWIPS